MARCDITPPVGIYHRFWGAAAHDRATGVHRPLTATVFLLKPQDSEHAVDSATADAEPHVFVAIDHCLFRPAEMDEVLGNFSRIIGVAVERITFLFSHTHSGGNICRGRAELPGGELIGPYLDALPGKLATAFGSAQHDLRPTTFTYGSAACDMGHNRDFWDAARNQFVCGFNPNEGGDLRVQVVRVTAGSSPLPRFQGERGSRTGESSPSPLSQGKLGPGTGGDGSLLAVIVTYPCHATTLAWENTLISPDYVGALRETVERATGVPCIFLPAPCGDIGPRDGFVGDPAIADRNGRQVAYAALSALESLPPPNTDFHYIGPVLSGATLGAWEHRPLSHERRHRVGVFRRRRWEIPFQFRADLPTVPAAEQQLERLLSKENEARSLNDQDEAQRCRALAERMRRLLERIRPLPADNCYHFPLQLWQLGDAFWAAVEGEPYYALFDALNQRFPEHPLVIMPLANGARSSYLPERADYEKPLYQVEVALLAPGCLEAVTDALAAQIDTWRGATHDAFY
jgi:hypothetical protein